MIETFSNIGWSMLFSLVGAFVGMALVLLASALVPKIMDRLTPNIDEGKKSPAEIWPWRNTMAEWWGLHHRHEHCHRRRGAGRHPVGAPLKNRVNPKWNRSVRIEYWRNSL